LVFVNVHLHFRIWTRVRIRNPRVTDPDPAKFWNLADPDPQHCVRWLKFAFFAVSYTLKMDLLDSVLGDNVVFFVPALGRIQF
jgi:hypothetical protein